MPPAASRLSDSINAIRLVVRYQALGLLVWWAAKGRVSVAPLVVLAIFTAGLVELAIVGAQLAMAIARLVRKPDRDSISSDLLYVDGSTGRYDRLGLLLMSVAIAALATSGRISLGRLVLVAACMATLYLSTSRQAVLGLAVACTLLAVFPRVSLGFRGLAAGLAVTSLVLVLIAPGGSATAASVDESDSAASAPTTTPGLIAPTPPPVPAKKGSAIVSLDQTATSACSITWSSRPGPPSRNRSLASARASNWPSTPTRDWRHSSRTPA